MNFEIVNKVAFLTGGASGLGYEIVRVLLKNGAKAVVFIDVNETKGLQAENDLMDEFGKGCCIFIRADCSNELQMKAAFDKTINTYSQLDIVINNAALLVDLDWKVCIATNLGGCICGTVLAVNEYLPKYKSGEEGILINVSSIAGIMPMGMCPVYSSTKHGIVALSRCFGLDKHYERTKVRVIVICPGHMETPMIMEPKEGSYDMEYVRVFGYTLDDFPLQKPEFVAECVPDLIKRAATGSVWIIENSEAPYEVVYPSFRKDVAISKI